MPAHGAAAVAAPAQHVEQHPVRHLEARHQPLRETPRSSRVERVLVPVHEVVLGRLPLDHASCPSRAAFSLRRMFSTTCSGACTTTKPRSSKPLRPARPAIWWKSRAVRCAVFWPSNLQRRVNRTVRIGTLMPDAQGVGAADHLEQAELRELLDEHPVLGQQSGVVQPDAVPEPLADRAAVRAREVEPGDPVGNFGLLLARADLQAREVLRAAGRVGLREVHDIGGRLPLGDQLLDRVRQGHFGVAELERDGPDRPTSP